MKTLDNLRFKVFINNIYNEILEGYLNLDKEMESELKYLWENLQFNWDNNAIRQMKENCVSKIEEYIR